MAGLIAYFSRRGNNCVNGSIANLPKGNTEIIAGFIRYNLEGSGMGRSESEIARICSGAKIERGLAVHGAEASGSRGLVEKWLRR